MAYTDEGVRAKLSALNETQESIVTVAQWIMFHRRYADRSAGVWLQKVRDSGVSKRLNLIYLANEVVQQSKARKKDDFLIAFSPIIADATATAYRGATSEVQSKLRRVVEVWRQRQIFDSSIQEAVEARIGEIDKSRSSGKKPLLGGHNPFGTSEGAVAVELQPLLPLQTSLNKAALAAASATGPLAAEYTKLLAPDAAIPSPPVYAARLSGLLKSLATAEGAVAASIQARTALIKALQRMLDDNTAALQTDESTQGDVAQKKAQAEATKRRVEDEILKGLSQETAEVGLQGSSSLSNNHDADSGDDEGDRPQMEALTPPPVESFTPPEEPQGAPDIAAVRSRAFEGMSDGGMAKRRKLEGAQQDLVSGDAMADLDDDVAELLRSEGGA